MSGRTVMLVALILTSPLCALRAQDKPDALQEYLAGRFDSARSICVEELTVDPGNLESYVVLSWSLLALGRWSDAENYAIRGFAIRKDPRLSEALGEAAYYLGKNQEALAYMKSYIVSLPEGDRVDRAFYVVGEVYVRLARYAHADIAFTAALSFAPKSAKYWARAGYAREQLGELVQSLQAYEEALKLNPSLQDARLGRDRVVKRLKGS